MRLKTWLVAALGLGSLVVLIAVSLLVSSQRAHEIYAQLDEGVEDLRARLGGLPAPIEAEAIWGNIWYEEAHNSTAIEGNTPPCTSPAGWSSSSRTLTWACASLSLMSSTSSP